MDEPQGRHATSDRDEIVVVHDPVDTAILIVDDEPSNVALLRRILHSAGYRRVEAETDPRCALERLDGDAPDVVLLDLHMPHVDGFAMLELLRPRVASTYVPVIVLTADATPTARLRALAAGATDFITKPFDVDEVVVRVRNVVQTQQLYRQLERFNAGLELRVRDRTRELERAHLDTVDRLAIAAEFRDDNTGEHIRRVGRTSSLLAATIGLPAEQVTTIERAATLHDVGKIGVRDGILLKPGPLTEREFVEIRRHTEIGARILAGATSSLLRCAEEIARYHHERWDGGGYAGVVEADIPLTARIAAIADAFDAMTSDRPYKQAITPQLAVAEIQACSGTQFDPNLVDAFVSLDMNDLAHGASRDGQRAHVGTRP